MRRGAEIHLSDSEWKVMGCVWAQSPTTAREVREALVDETDWAYTTVKTLLARLVDKGALSVSMQGNRSLYEPLVTQERAQRSAVRSLVERAFGGHAAPMMQFLMGDKELSSRDRQELKKLLDRRKSRR